MSECPADIKVVDNAEIVENTYSEQRIINVDKLEGVYNETLTSYLDNYENYLKNKSKLIDDTPKLARKYRYRILKDNHKLLTIIRTLYNNIKHTDEEHTNTKTKNIPVVFLSAAFKKEEFVRHGFELGAVDYFTKPIEKYSFLAKIKIYIELFTKQKELVFFILKI